ncbi:MAG TPA: VanW family protein [Kofleriaceae bacterium]
MSGTRVKQRGTVLLGCAGAMVVIAGGLGAGYYAVSTRSVASAATLPEHGPEHGPEHSGETPGKVQTGGKALATHLDTPIAISLGGKQPTLTTKTLKELGVEVDPDELGRGGAADSAQDLAALAAKGSVPVRVDREKAAKALAELKTHLDVAPVDAFLDLEEHKIEADTAGKGIDIWGSLGKIEAAARQGGKTLELSTVAVPARTTTTSIGIDDVSEVMGHYITRFSVGDRDRNFNLKLAASKINGTVLQPHQEWSFNGQVGERSEKEGYKIAHVITAGEMVDGLAGGTCQISTTLFGAAFFAGLDIVKTTNHSRPSTYTPLGFDATVVWPDTDLVLKNPYDFPVALHYRVANGEAVVEILGKKRPFDKVVFAREITEETPFNTEERIDEEMPDGQTSLDQAGFDGYKMTRYRRFFVGKKQVREQKWTVNYKPVTEYVRRGTNKDPNAKMPPTKELHGPKPPGNVGDKFEMNQ